MSGIGVKYAVRRYQPSPYAAVEGGAEPLTPKGKEQTFNEWRDVVAAADTIIGDNGLQTGVPPSDPVVLKHGDDVVLIYTKLEV